MIWLVWIGALLLLGHWLDLFGLGRVTIWWLFIPFAIAAFWFEVVELRLGHDRRKAFDEMDQAKRERIARNLGRPLPKRGRKR